MCPTGDDMKNWNASENQTARRILPTGRAIAVVAAFAVTLSQPAYGRVTPYKAN